MSTRTTDTTLNIEANPLDNQAEIAVIESQIKLDVIAKRWWFIGLSILLTIPGLVFMVMSMMSYPDHAPLKLGIDFTGGMMYRMAFVQKLDQTDVNKMNMVIENLKITGPIIQLEQADNSLKGTSKAIVTTTEEKTKAFEEALKEAQAASKNKKESVSDLFKDSNKTAVKTDKNVKFQSIVSIRTKPLVDAESKALNNALKTNFGEFAVLEKNQIGPTLAKELFVQAGMGLLVTFALIVLYLSIRFKLDYATSALIALFHDAVFVVGTFSMLGWFYHMEVNSLFVTAVLTVIGFSVHDTIVVFDRVRENTKRYYSLKLPIRTLINLSVNQTFARSINTSLTALITLTALYLFGGDSTKQFLLALIMGIATGTYSSIFVASILLCMWREKQEKSQPVVA